MGRPCKIGARRLAQTLGVVSAEGILEGGSGGLSLLLEGDPTPSDRPWKRAKLIRPLGHVAVIGDVARTRGFAHVNYVTV